MNKHSYWQTLPYSMSTETLRTNIHTDRRHSLSTETLLTNIQTYRPYSLSTETLQTYIQTLQSKHRDPTNKHTDIQTLQSEHRDPANIHTDIQTLQSEHWDLTKTCEEKYGYSSHIYMAILAIEEKGYSSCQDRENSLAEVFLFLLLCILTLSLWPKHLFHNRRRNRMGFLRQIIAPILWFAKFLQVLE